MRFFIFSDLPLFSNVEPNRFVISFAVLSELINDERTRTFLTMEVGAGHHEV